MSLKTGDIVRFERTFTLNDVELFIKISGDEGIHHMYLRGNIIITKKKQSVPTRKWTAFYKAK